MADSRKSKLKSTLEELITKFEKNRDEYQSTHYIEAQLRMDFINLLFQQGLGWDVSDDQALGVRKCEVMVERGDSGNRPDYNFRIDGDSVFYVEVKRPAENLDDSKWVLQAKGYAWSERRVNVVALTNFEWFRLFDATLKPDSRHPNRGEIFSLHYSEYLDNLDKLLVLQRESVAEGSLDKVLLTDKKSKQLRKPPDEAFLEDLNGWRKKLASGLYKKSGYSWNDYDISAVVQQLLDRLIFVRIAEERNIIEPHQLRDKLNYWNESDKKLNFYDELLIPLFKTVNVDLNGDLFKPGVVDNAPFDDEDIAELIDELYPPRSIYRFDAMPIEIIGQAYEQYLGNIIRCTPKTIKIEPKPEHTKEQGVYYTPKYIVDYIVGNTVGKLVNGKTPEQVEQITILDPACGSGSFLIGALEYLINYVESYYHDNLDEVKRDELFPYLIEDYDKGTTRLSLERKLKLLTNCIYGVDIDPQAVEVTKLSLYLKVLENERLLPQKKGLLKPLYKNIKCGNSIIGTDYWGFVQSKQGELFERTLKVERQINPFDWDFGFSNTIKYDSGTHRLKNGYGFDAVIGNPPWGAELSENERTYLEKYFGLHNTDTACLFIAKSMELLAQAGLHGFIVPKSFVYASNWKYVRERYIDNIREIVDCGKVWKKVKLEQIIYLMKKGKAGNKYISIVREDESFKDIGTIGKDTFSKFGLILNGVTTTEIELGEKIRQTGKCLNDYVLNQRGSFLQNKVTNEIHDTKVIGGKRINRYGLKETPKGYIAKKDITDPKAYIDEYSIIAQNIIAHIMNPNPHVKIIATILPENKRNESIILDTVNEFKNQSEISSYLLLGILNSKLISWFVYKFIFGNAIRTMHFDNPVTSRIPYPDFGSLNKNQNAICEQIVSKVNEMLDYSNRITTVKSDADKNRLQQSIENSDKRINDLVYELYGITSPERDIIDGK